MTLLGEDVLAGREGAVGGALRISEDDIAMAASAAGIAEIVDPPLIGTQYLGNPWDGADNAGNFEPGPIDLLPGELAALDRCLRMADVALRRGDPPVGAVLLHRPSDRSWGALTQDKTERQLGAHAEIMAYNDARKVVRDNLRDCTLITTAEPCTTCTPIFAEGKIGRIVMAATRAGVRKASGGLMRARRHNMHDMLADGESFTLVTSGHRGRAALTRFAIWGELARQGKVRK